MKNQKGVISPDAIGWAFLAAIFAFIAFMAFRPELCQAGMTEEVVMVKTGPAKQQAKEQTKEIKYATSEYLFTTRGCDVYRITDSYGNTSMFHTKCDHSSTLETIGKTPTKYETVTFR